MRCWCSLHAGYVEDMKQLLFTLTKPEMAEVYSRYSAKAPEPLSAQFNDRIDKQSAVTAYKEKCGKIKNIQYLFVAFQVLLCAYGTTLN